jgi:AcrR family transcriptional regulator
VAVKRRAYTSDRRRAQARQTRRSILDAAHELFVARGYAATSVQAIAEHAGVAVQTVYAVFGSKRELLRQLIESTITGDDEPGPIAERPEAQAVGAELDARRRAELDAALSRSIIQRVAPIARVVTEAAASDPELAEMFEAVKAARRHEMTSAATVLAGPQGLRTPADEAAATLYVLYSPQVADMLMHDYQWPPERYERWLARMLLQTVIQEHEPDPPLPETNPAKRHPGRPNR